jgi:hypothetical protein
MPGRNILPAPDLLLGEGPDDANLLYHLLKHHSVPVVERDRTSVAGVDIRDGGGINTLLNAIPVWLRRSELQRLGIVIDADSDIAARWQSLQDRLRGAGYNTVPNTPNPAGTIITQPDLPAVGVWLMPNNVLPGMLEDFARLLMPANDTLWLKAAQCLQSLDETERRFSANHLSKAHLHTWLAWQEEPGKPIGQAVTNCYFDANAPQAQQLIEWIRRLFNLPLP